MILPLIHHIKMLNAQLQMEAVLFLQPEIQPSMGVSCRNTSATILSEGERLELWISAEAEIGTNIKSQINPS